jgi:hypothetical protein
MAAAAGVVFGLCGAAELSGALTNTEAPAPGSRLYANAWVIAVGPGARTLTVRGGGIGDEETLTVEPQARPDARALKPGDQVLLALRAVRAGEETVTRIERSASAAASHRGAGRRDASREGSPPVASPPKPRETPAASAPSPTPTPLPTDTVGPLRDPRVDPNFDPHQNPLRDPRVIPGLSEPAPTPTPTPAKRQ